MRQAHTQRHHRNSSMNFYLTNGRVVHIMGLDSGPLLRSACPSSGWRETLILFLIFNFIFNLLFY